MSNFFHQYGNVESNYSSSIDTIEPNILNLVQQYGNVESNYGSSIDMKEPNILNLVQQTGSGLFLKSRRSKIILSVIAMCGCITFAVMGYLKKDKSTGKRGKRTSSQEKYLIISLILFFISIAVGAFAYNVDTLRY